jgi:hypothetical protein
LLLEELILQSGTTDFEMQLEAALMSRDIAGLL